MASWYQLSNVEHIADGDFLEARIAHQSGLHLHEAQNFLEDLAELAMARYQSRQARPRATRSLSASVLETPERTKQFFRRWFDGNGIMTQAFITEVSETLIWWIESELNETKYSKRFPPHNKIPTVDVLSVVQDNDKQLLRLVQVKATEDDLQDNCSEAVSKFTKLCKGDYDAEFDAELEIIENDRQVPDTVNLTELRLNDRLYRVTVVHGCDRDGIRIATLFAEKIPGSSEVRSVHLVRVEWPDFWSKLARMVYAKLR